MSRSEIIVTADPRGVFKEGTITGTPLPGTVMEITPATALDSNGRPTYRAYQPGTDGNRRPIFILLEDFGQGLTKDDAYVTGSHGFLYVPVAGEEFMMLFGNAGGTADDIAVGDMLIVDDSTGKVIETTGSPESEPFIALDAIVDPVADQHLHCMYTGY